MPEPTGARPTDTRRLFLALHPPEAALTELEPTVAAARERRPDLRWAPRQNYHLTLVFIGEVSEERLPRLRELVGRKLVRHQPPTLALRGAGTFPGDPERGRVLWAGLTGDVAALVRLADALRAAVAAARLPVEERRYTPHLTLARSAEPTDLREAAAPLDGFAGTPWPAEEVALVQSVRGEGQPRYQTVTTWPLPWEQSPPPARKRNPS